MFYRYAGSEKGFRRFIADPVEKGTGAVLRPRRFTAQDGRLLAAATAATAIVAAIIVAKQEKDDNEQDPGAITVAKKSADAHLLSPPFVGYIPYYVAPRRLVTAYILEPDGACYTGKGRDAWDIAIIARTSPKGSWGKDGSIRGPILFGNVQPLLSRSRRGWKTGRLRGRRSVKRRAGRFPREIMRKNRPFSVEKVLNK
mgnify:CR=1 FL=1